MYCHPGLAVQSQAEVVDKYLLDLVSLTWVSSNFKEHLMLRGEMQRAISVKGDFLLLCWFSGHVGTVLDADQY